MISEHAVYQSSSYRNFEFKRVLGRPDVFGLEVVFNVSEVELLVLLALLVRGDADVNVLVGV